MQTIIVHNLPAHNWPIFLGIIATLEDIIAQTTSIMDQGIVTAESIGQVGDMRGMAAIKHVY